MPTPFPQPPSSTPRSAYLMCKVCDRGALSSKTVFRMSGPVVAIGFILLIPSILGIVACALMLIGVGVAANAAHKMSAMDGERTRLFQSTSDAGFRKSCAKSFKQSYYQTQGLPASQSLAEQYCECALSTFKESGSLTFATETCSQRAMDPVKPLDKDVDAFYSDDAGPQPPTHAAIEIFRVFGSVSAVVLGIWSFVGGLLGWLLVMRKRVLKCDDCGAVVNAS